MLYGDDDLLNGFDTYLPPGYVSSVTGDLDQATGFLYYDPDAQYSYGTPYGVNIKTADLNDGSSRRWFNVDLSIQTPGPNYLTIYSRFGNDEIHGGAGLDAIYGDKGYDKLFGEDDNDVIYGASGDDYLSGGAGDDTLSGGAGFATSGFLDAIERKSPRLDSSHEILSRMPASA